MIPMIVGLPRSRTAWLSVFMSQSNTYFHHEGIDGCYSIDEYQSKTKGCGDSTTGFWPILESMELKRVVIIRKSEAEFNHCVEWCDSTYGINSIEHMRNLNEYMDTIDGLVINQSEINDRLQDIWEHLVDDEWSERHAALTKLNVSVNDTGINEEAARALYAAIQ